jgi:hypothetical protein
MVIGQMNDRRDEV